MTRIAVLGDLSGHLAPFVQALGELGVDVAAARVPDDLVVVQVGDLVHKGPDSDTIVALVDRLLDANPGRYLQLLVNHEDLTRLNFLHHIGSEDAGQAAEVLNGLLETRPKVIHATGVMLTDLRS